MLSSDSFDYICHGGDAYEVEHLCANISTLLRCNYTCDGVISIYMSGVSGDFWIVSHYCGYEPLFTRNGGVMEWVLRLVYCVALEQING